MERAGRKVRDIQFYSAKNEGQVCVHTSFARAYAKHLEKLDEVKSYEAGYALDQERFKNVSPVSIRKDYFTGGWETDFPIHYQDGRCAVRELVVGSMLALHCHGRSCICCLIEQPLFRSCVVIRIINLTSGIGKYHEGSLDLYSTWRGSIQYPRISFQKAIVTYYFGTSQMVKTGSYGAGNHQKKAGDIRWKEISSFLVLVGKSLKISILRSWKV